MHKTKNLFLQKRKIIILAIVVVLAVSFFLFRSNGSNNVNIDSVKLTDLTKSVRATGQVISTTDLDLSFNKASVIKSVKVNVGDTVNQGQILATLDQGQALATLTQAKGALLSAQAKYDKILQGASSEEIILAEVGLKNAKTELENTKNNQAVLVTNAYINFLNSSIEVSSTSMSSSQSFPIISGTYVLEQEGNINMTVYQGGNSNYFSASGLVNASGTVSTTVPQPIGNSGLYIIFPTVYSPQGDLLITIPNKKATNYLTNFNAYKNALANQTNTISTGQSIVDQKQAELNLKKAIARNVDIDIAKAEVLSAEGSLQSAQASYEDTIIRAPVSGTITKVDIKYGELAEAGKLVITLEDVKNLYIEALINEANIAYLKIGQSVDITFDAFGNNKKFTGTIAHIDPSAETNDGVVNYKIKVSIAEKDETIRPGMNANIDVLAGEAKNILAIPNIAVMEKEGKSFVNVVLDEKKKKYEKREVQTGFVGDNNLIEIVSGLKQDEKIALTAN